MQNSIRKSVVTESRPLDHFLDTSFISSNVKNHPNLLSSSERKSVSTATIATGKDHYKYHRNPETAKLQALNANVLLSSSITSEKDDILQTSTNILDPYLPNVKDAEVQTMYRESEAQTYPYTPGFTIPDGETPDILLLKDLKYGNGLPLSIKDMNIVEHARAKRQLEANLPPFTDEASLLLRKQLMEKQEIIEFKFREHEIDAKREEKLANIKESLIEKHEAQEYLAMQRIESVRSSLMEERKKTLAKIESKKIKALRKLVQDRSYHEPVLHDTITKNDVIDNIFNKTSSLYVPLKRDGIEKLHESNNFDVTSRVLPLEDASNILSFEESIPAPLLDSTRLLTLPRTELLSKTASSTVSKLLDSSRNRVFEVAASITDKRADRMIRNDVNEMFRILNLENSMSRTKLSTQNTIRTTSSRAEVGTDPMSESLSNSLPMTASSGKTKTRPSTPDIRHLTKRKIIEYDQSDPISKFCSDGKVLANIIDLQSYIRGMQVQQEMQELREHYKDAIAELKATDAIEAKRMQEESHHLVLQHKYELQQKIFTSTEDLMIGSVISKILSQMFVDSEADSKINHHEEKTTKIVNKNNNQEEDLLNESIQIEDNGSMRQSVGDMNDEIES